jgi:hypothetical protein
LFTGRFRPELEVTFLNCEFGSSIEMADILAEKSPSDLDRAISSRPQSYAEAAAFFEQKPIPRQQLCGELRQPASAGQRQNP